MWSTVHRVSDPQRIAAHTTPMHVNGDPVYTVFASHGFPCLQTKQRKRHIVIQTRWALETIIQYKERILQRTVVIDGETLPIDELFEPPARDACLDE